MLGHLAVTVSSSRHARKKACERTRMNLPYTNKNFHVSRTGEKPTRMRRVGALGLSAGKSHSGLLKIPSASQ